MENSSILNQMRQDAVKIFNAGLEAVKPETCIHGCCRLENDTFFVNQHAYNLDKFKKIIVLGAGKAGASMASAIEDIFKDRISSGIVIVKYGHVKAHNRFVPNFPNANFTSDRIDLVEAAHPVPDKNGVAGAEKLLKAAEEADKNTLVICLISGGGSALMTLPAEGITLEDKQRTTEILLGCGADIHEINTIRKHLSRIKGGFLAQAVYPATMICLVLSDVVGDDLETIASGPGVADEGTFGHCLEIIETRGIKNRLPKSVINHLTKGNEGLFPETLKKGNPVFEKVFHKIIATNINALLNAQKKAEQLGYNSLILSSMIQGETMDAASFHAAVAAEILATGHPVKPPACILSGGETTVTIQGKGKGGRNQEFALAFAIRIKDMENTVLLSAGTDGSDGPTDAAGAIADHTTVERAAASFLIPEQFLRDNNSYFFFDKISDLFKTGPTNTNVMDIKVMLVR